MVIIKILWISNDAVLESFSQWQLKELMYSGERRMNPVARLSSRLGKNIGRAGDQTSDQSMAIK